MSSWIEYWLAMIMCSILFSSLVVGISTNKLVEAINALH